MRQERHFQVFVKETCLEMIKSQGLKGDTVALDMETWIWLHKFPSKGHHIDACLKTVMMQLGQGHNTAVSQGNKNDQYGPLI